MGLIAGIVGILCGFSGVLFSGFIEAFHVDGTGGLTIASWIVVAVSVLGIIGALVINNKTALGSLFMIVAAIVGFIFISFFYTVPAILFLISGIMGFVRKDESGVAA